MKLLKTIAYGTCLMLLSTAVFAQSRSNETSVEDIYLTNVQDVIITELANSDTRDNKLVALEYLEEAVNAGRVTPDMTAALDQLAGEGVTTQSKTNGRVVNNYPDVRKKSCDILAKVPTKESKNTLVKIALQDNEPMVITAAIRSLGKIGINDNDEVINVIAFANRHNIGTGIPAGSMALEVINAYERLAPTVQDRSVMLESLSKIYAETKYPTPVRKKALDLLNKLRSESRKQ